MQRKIITLILFLFVLMGTNLFAQEYSLEDFVQALKDDNLDRVMEYIGDTYKFGAAASPEYAVENDREEARALFQSVFPMADAADSIDIEENPDENIYSVTINYASRFQFIFEKQDDRLVLIMILVG